MNQENGFSLVQISRLVFSNKTYKQSIILH
jgi:hypothetical protein